MNQKIYIIVAVDDEMGIGKNGKLPWHLKNELKYFADVTTKVSDPAMKNMVIMGRNTWESIPENHRPLKGRLNVVLTRNSDYSAEDAEVFDSLDAAIDSADSSIETIFIIGGAQVIKQVMSRPDLAGIYLTQIRGTFDCDTFFPEIPTEFGDPVSLGGAEEDGAAYEYLFYSKNS